MAHAELPKLIPGPRGRGWCARCGTKLTYVGTKNTRREHIAEFHCKCHVWKQSDMDGITYSTAPLT